VINKSFSNKSKSKTAKKTKFKDNMIYFEGKVVETLPGVRFVVRIERPNGREPLEITCSTKTSLIKSRVKIIKGDSVVVELDPNDLTQGTIVERK
jgi:translation initiation factor IF-1